MTNTPLVSIVVPVYNGELYIEGCVKQIQAQDYKNIEVIFVNDGSKDRSQQVCEKAIASDSRFSLINKENGGTATTRNKGLDNAHGKYITFLDCDDEFDSTLISSMVHEMERDDEFEPDLVVCGYYFKVEKEVNGKTETTYLEAKKYPYRVFHNFDEMRSEYIDIWDNDMFSNVWNKLFRMSTIQKYGMRYRDGHVYTEDRVFNRLYLSKCTGVVIIDKCLVYYIREREGSTTEKYRDDGFIIRDKEYNEFKAHFKEMHIWNEVSQEYTSREFIERIAGCIENVFHAGNSLTVEQKYKAIKYMISHKDCREASKYAKCRSRKMRIMAAPIKANFTPGAFVLGWTIYKIRTANPVLFHKLKGSR